MTSPRRPLSGWPALRTVLGTLALILSLLGMHAGTGTSAAWAATGTAAATTVHHLGPGAIGPAGMVPEVVLPAEPAGDEAADPGLLVCALEAVDDTCASALTKAPVVSHLASRALLPSPGGGLTAPPLPWVAHFRPPWTLHWLNWPSAAPKAPGRAPPVSAGSANTSG